MPAHFWVAGLSSGLVPQTGASTASSTRLVRADRLQRILTVNPFHPQTMPCIHAALPGSIRAAQLRYGNDGGHFAGRRLG